MAIKVKTVKLKKKATKPYKSPAALEAEKRRDRIKSGKASKVGSIKSGIARLARGIAFKLKKFESLGVRALPETAFTRKGMTLRQLIRSTPRLFINNAIDVEAHKYKKKRTLTGKPVLQGIMWTNDPYRPDKVRRYHETYIVGLDDDQDKPIHKHKKVLCQCACEAFVYNFEYANATVGASRLIYSNGQPPVYTNPGLLPGLCVGENELVITDTGQRPISTVNACDYVWTRGCWRKVVAAWCSGKKETGLFKASFGAVRLTKTHLVYGSRNGVKGWFEAQDFRAGDYAYLSVGSTFEFVPFDSFSDFKVENVYDIEVDTVPEFVAGSLLVHNCKHLVALAKIAMENDL